MSGPQFNFSTIAKAKKEAIVATPEEYVKRFGGTRVISKILIANNGIAAVKCIRSIRRWSYEIFRNERAVKFVVMVTPEDLKANAEYIRLADQYIPVPGGTNNNNYANVDLILDIAKRTKVQGVWAGWGHASEFPRLPESLHRNNIIFIGPPEHAMWALGDKIASSIVAQSCGVPTLPWNGSHLKIEYDLDQIAKGEVVTVPQDIYTQGCVANVSEGLKSAKEIGFPVMIKASEGGGGKGIRKVNHEDDFPNAFRQVQTEVPGSPIFIMQLAKGSRHLEVQVLADKYGNAVSLFGRDCSIQRRHQKIIEEAPITIAPEHIRTKMEKAAVTLAKLVGYQSAGTVEYLYNPTDESFHFLELNPRLQVEHPCTEMVCDVNLPSAMLEVGMGIPLWRIKTIRTMYGEDPMGDSKIDFENPAYEPKPRGHVIASRITSENPDEGFKPSSGTVQELNFRSSKNVWGYFSVSAAGGLHEFADSQFGHCFSWGEDRNCARENMVIALKELSIRGDFRTTVEYLITLFETECFQRNSIDTAWLDKLIAEKIQSEKPDPLLGVLCGGLHVAEQTILENLQNFQSTLERGQILPANSLKNSCEVELIHEGIKYRAVVSKLGPTSFLIRMNDSFIEVDAHRLSDGGLLISLDGDSHTTYMKEEVGGYRVVIGNKTCNLEKENDPAALRAPSTGKLINFLVEDGAHIAAGSVYAEIEVMKMIMELRVNESGVINHIKRSGAILEAGDLVARLELDDPSRVQKAIPYQGKLPETTHNGNAHGDKLHQIFQRCKQTLINILDGYCEGEEHFKNRVRTTVETLMKCLNDPALPLLELQELVSAVSGRIPPEVEREIKQSMASYASNITSILCQFPSHSISKYIDSYAASIQRKTERDVYFMTVQGIVQLTQRYLHGTRGHMRNVVAELIKKYVDVEKQFQHFHYDKCVAHIRDTHKKDMAAVSSVILSHAHVAEKNTLIITLLDQLFGGERDFGLTEDMQKLLTELTMLNKVENSKVALKARQILIAAHQPAYELRHNQVENIFLKAIDTYGHDISPDNLKQLIKTETLIFDVLHDFFFYSNLAVRRAAFEVYVRRAYIAYDLNCIQHDLLKGDLCIVEFQFLLPSSHPNRFHQRKTSYMLPRVSSLGDEMAAVANYLPCQRTGVMAAFRCFDEFVRYFDDLLKRFVKTNNCTTMNGDDASHQYDSRRSSSSSLGSVLGDDEPIHILNIAISCKHDEEDRELADRFEQFCVQHRPVLNERGIRRATFILLKNREFPKYFTFRSREGFTEDRIYRHLEPALAFQLEINRMRNFNLEAIPVANHRIHLYLGRAKQVAKGQEVTDYRFFVRVIIRHSDLVSREASFEYLRSEGERMLLEAMDALEVAFEHPLSKRTDCNHVFLNFVPTMVMADPIKIEDTVRNMVMCYGHRIWKLRVLQAEVKMNVKKTQESEPMPIRVFVNNDSGYYLDITTYKEINDGKGGQVHFESLGKKKGPLHGLILSTPYMTKDQLQLKRFQAQSAGTTYAYDLPELFKQALVKLWKKYYASKGEAEENFQNTELDCFSFVELVIGQDGKLKEFNRLQGENDCGMVAWKFTLKTPEFPNGRSAIVIANDITFQIGSFGPKEDDLFLKASELARAEGIPRIYVSANSGARIGLAKEIMHHFRVAWKDDKDVEKGFNYLYLTPDDYKKVMSSVHVEHVVEKGESRYKLLDIIGAEDGLGVENLRGSGTIAGETSQAYNEIPTISLVTCRAVGIGAYLVRLGQRVVQTENAHIILTGAGALNKVLGREVYTSNNQLGGIQIMHNNGVTHTVVKDDFEGVEAILRWLAYVPRCRDGPLPILTSQDPIEREIEFKPPKTPHDPRLMLDGKYCENGRWISGFFDKNSWEEMMAPWAQTVITGRARLGGIPVGVICVETRSVEAKVPADPANLDSETLVIPQAGQVWFPDSAYKTAQAIKDLNREQLPLFIFANWRGFSGGMKDMYDQVLKFGSYIVDGLREYKQPIIVYLPPGAELRGGAWVVVDPTINERHMEMYADKESRGGVLEPAGTVEIKFKLREQIKAMTRLDETYRKLKKSLNEPNLTPADKIALEKKLRERESLIAPVYHQIAIAFADLHDTAGRMQEKGVINDVLTWKTSRKYLYWRLRRLLLEETYIKKVQELNPTLNDAQIRMMLSRWFTEHKGAVNAYLWEDDNMTVTEWLQTQLDNGLHNSGIAENLAAIRRDYALEQIKKVLKENEDIAMDSVAYAISILNAGEKSEVVKMLSENTPMQNS
ncbi:DgyrCDS6195 [Dimorphilus gyrociliatus]|nr:DgyrCDS6195 [Dimorphilus gyrociliatus]